MMGMAALAVFGLLAACATSPASAPQPAVSAAPTGVRITGTVSYLQRIALPPNSEVIVQLRDVSRMDVAAGLLAEQRFTARSQAPLPFELTVDPGKIDPRMRYAVAARIEQGGKLMFINDKLYPVLTQGHGSRVEMVLYMVANPSPPERQAAQAAGWRLTRTTPLRPRRPGWPMPEPALGPG